MTEKFISYKTEDGRIFDIPESRSVDFENKYPSATIEMHANNKVYDIPLSEKQRFIDKYGEDASYVFDKNEERISYETESKEADNKTSLGETVVKGLGAAGVRTAKLALDLGQMAFNTSVLGGAANKIRQWTNPEHGAIDEELRDETNSITRASMKLGEVADKLSREADPTGGEKGFSQLIREGKIGQVAQKALGSGLESLPMMIAAGTGWGALLYGAGMAAGEYADETRENPEIASWKRGIKSLGSAALEMAVEKIGGPLKNIGKAGKEISEEMAKEILETAIKEGTENTAKRIIKKIGKEGLEEGGEELLTSFGNDALGQALDWIDGNADYGITAQWEQMKEQNPDASISDFAWAKAEEYMDSFIGGAVSGMEISSTVDGANYLANRRTGNVMQAAREFGAAKNFGDMYDTDSDVASSKESLVSAFTTEGGEQAISNEFIDGLSAEDAFALSGREEFSGEQRRAFRQLAITKATQDGLTQKLDDELEKNIATIREKADRMSDNGQIVTGVLNGRPVYIKGGVVNNGAISATKDGANGPVIVIDAETGEETTANSKDISSVSSVDIATFVADSEAFARNKDAQNREIARNTMSVNAKYKAIRPLEGKKLKVDFGNGIIDVQIERILPQTGEVLIKGKKGDLGGQSNTKIGIGVFYDSISRDDDGNPIFVEGGEIVDDVPIDDTPTDEPIELTGEEDFRDYVGPILINGVPVQVEVQSQDNPTDSIVYTYIDENGRTQRGTASIKGFAEAVQQAKTNTPEPAPQTEPEATSEPIPEPIPEAPVVEAPVTPQAINWDVLFEQDPEGYFTEMQKQFGDKTAKRLNAVIAATQKRLDALNKSNPQTDNEILENEDKKEKLEAKIAALNDMVARLAAPVTPEVPSDTAPVADAPVEEEPAPAPEIPAEPASEPTPAPVAETPEVPTEPTPVPDVPVVETPVAPNPVANPIDEARKKERQLALNLKKIGLSPEHKQDLAYNAGKAIADMFATREEYDAYAESATDFGQYNADFERGVDDSFAARNQQNTGNTPVNSVPLENEPNGENNGEQQPTSNEPTTEGRGSDTTGGGTNDGGNQEGGEGTQKTKSPRRSKGKKSGEQVEDKYPARKGNATQKLLVDTFGFESVTIPNARKEILNTIYDFMMEMSKTLGISPKSIGQGGWLSIGNMRSNRNAIAAHQIKSNTLTRDISEVSLRFKYARLSSIAHEWWHSLDRALGYFNTGKLEDPTSEVRETSFTGRAEVWEAVKGVMDAINNSGYTARIEQLVKRQTRAVREYFLRNTEQAARAFDEYITMRFAEAGITIDNYDNHRDDTQPTAEEMKVIAPAIENLFSVLKEKEGKTSGTSVLYHISEEMEPQSDAKKFATESILTALDDDNREVVIMDDEQTKQYLKAIGADTDTQFSIDTDKPIFLSNAAIAVMGIKQEKATPEQWLKMIEKAGGLKAGEDKWMGLSDWLKAQDAKTLTKQEVLDFINENTIRIEEVNYKQWDALDYIDEAVKILEAEMREIGWDAIVEKYPRFDELFEEYNGELMWSETRASVAEYEQFIFDEHNLIERPINETRENYTTDGLDNKREIAIIVPTIEPWSKSDVIHFGDAGDGRAVAWVRFGEARAYSKEYSDFYDFQKKMQQKYYSDRVIAALSDSDLEALTAEEREEFMRLRDIARSVPFGKRTNRRVLVIDEIQSKRHQEGRENGYLSKDAVENRKKARDRAKKASNALYDYIGELVSKYPGTEYSLERVRENRGRFTKDENIKLTLLIMESNNAELDLEKSRTDAIPDAPFDKNWHELAMKRMLRYAAENGYDAVAWTKGEQQAERYNISKRVDNIDAEDSIIEEFEDGTPVAKFIHLDLASGESVPLRVDADGNVRGGRFHGNNLSDIIGKELAVKVMQTGNIRLSGEGLRVGGEGMKGFYDKMLPAFMNKYGKKWGVKVADITLPHVEEAGRVMHSVPVNDAMKESVMEGQPMFYKTPNGIVYGWTDGKKIYLTKAGLNPNTPIHEYTHLWAKAMMLRNPKGWESIKKLLKGTPVWNEVMNDANYSNIHSNEDLVASEALSRISGSENAAKMEQMAQKMIDEAKGTGRKLEARGLIQNIKDALNKFWNWVGTELFKIEKFESIDEITDRVLWDLVNKTDLGITEEKKSADSDRSGVLSGTTSSINLSLGGKQHLSSHHLAHQESDANLKTNFETIKRKVQKFINSGYEIEGKEKIKDETQLVQKLAKILGFEKSETSISYYGEYETSIDIDGKKYKVRLSNHKASGEWMSKGTFDERVSLVVEAKDSEGRDGGDKYFVEYVTDLKGNHTVDEVAQIITDSVLNLLSGKKVDRKLFDEYHKRNLEAKVAEIEAEMQSLKDTAIANGTFMTAPNGQPTNLNERQWLQVRTESFKDWFGDWENYPEDSSKIVDENGEPMVMYHGSAWQPLSEPLGNAVFKMNDGMLGKGAYFSSSLAEATGYAEIATDLDMTEGGNYEILQDEFVTDYFLNIRNEQDIYRGGDSMIAVAKSPSQIKSATDNVGTFDVDDADIRYRKSNAQNAAVDYLAGPQRNEVIERAVNEEAAKLGVSVTYVTREQMPKGHKSDKGYFNTETGEIVICTENAASIADAIQTILHEAVAHKGLRQLMGDKFNEFINRVYDSLDAETKAKVDALAESKYNGNTAVAMEEYMASLAETENFAENSVWDKIKSAFENIINAILGRNDIKIGDNELRYILRASYNNMVNPRNMESIKGWARDQMMREDYKINHVAPELLSRTGIDPTQVSTQTASLVYDQVVSDSWQEFQRQFQDAMQPVRIAIDAIQQETGNIPIEDYENYILIQNQSSSRSRVEIDDFARRYYSPIIEQVENIIDIILESRGLNKKDKNNRSEVYTEIRQYMIAKHGLERNLYYQSHNTRKLRKSEKDKAEAEAKSEYDEVVNAINADTSLTDAERELQLREAKDAFDAALLEIDTREVPDVRDYSGLTALFGMKSKDFRKAEEEAQILIDNFEAQIGDASAELWKRINKATDKTLRHSYESGLLSRQQYNDIKAMFQFYIPLRGFDESTAEDVYSYARFEGNKFNPAVYKTGGRTSLADDPIAIIMNMAESEIAQGNKNRAKQALYNFILNRTITDDNGNQHQNSLMQIEDVWYIKNEDSEGNAYYTIATPNYERGETYEEFEERMNALAEEERAYKSKKGKVNIGMRFQKPANVNAHYVYLKINGVEKAIYINGDPRAADAINGTRRPEKNAIFENVRNINRILSSTFTNYSLEFTARNYFRDMLYSHINIGVRESDPAYRKKFRQNWRHNNLGTMMKFLSAYRAGEFDGKPLNEDEAAFVEFMNNGGQTGYTLINSVENHKKDLERAIKNMQKGIEHGGVKDSAVFKATLGSIELLNEASELVTRFAAFKTSRDMGRSVVKSISDAKEITVNFNTRGAQDGKGLWGGISHYLGWSKFFFNASVQGVQNIKAMKDANKLKFCTTVGGVMAFGFMMPVIISSIAAILGSDDEEEYWNIPEYDRQNNFCIPVGGGKYVKIPLPIGFREVYAMGDMLAAMAFDKKFTRDTQQIGMDMANKIASVVLPINPLESSANGLSIWHTGLYTLLPSSMQFLVQNATNIDWKGAPLQKEYSYNENDPQWMKAYASNPDWMVSLSKWCNEHIGSGDMKGVDWSPEKLDNTLSNLFGGIYTLVKKTGKSFSMIWNEENRNLSNVPLSGVVLSSGIDKDDRFVTDAYYEEKEYYDDRIGKINRAAKLFGYNLEDVFLYKKGQHHPKMMEIYNNKEFDFMQEWYKGNKELEKLEKEIKKFESEIAKSANPSEGMLNRLAQMKDRLAVEKREFVNDLLELD